VRDEDKVAALVRLFEMEDVTSALLFTRTKVRASEIAEALRTRKYPVEALHGDLKQTERERVMARFRKGYVNIVVATDVAARGIDIENVSHVVNVDVPLDPESYVHRIGRTGRAGRDGTAITLVTPSDFRRLLDIERFVKQNIPSADLPTKEAVMARRDDRFVDAIVAKLAMEEAEDERTLVNQIAEYGYDPIDIAAAAIQMARAREKMRPIEEIKAPKQFSKAGKQRKTTRSGFNKSKKKNHNRYTAEAGMVRLSINMGKSDRIRPGNIVGAIANTTGIPGSAIGAIDIQQNKTFLDVSEKYADDVMRKMRNWKMQDKKVVIQST
jgi:ATP-dependent RNA helicase DeaD